MYVRSALPKAVLVIKQLYLGYLRGHSGDPREFLAIFSQISRDPARDPCQDSSTYRRALVHTHSVRQKRGRYYGQTAYDKKGVVAKYEIPTST